MARMKHHGGTCCGMTHLYLEGRIDPAVQLPAVKKFDWADFKDTSELLYAYPRDVKAGIVPGMKTMGYPPKFSVTRPIESAKDRALALIDEAKGGGARHGIIEVILAGKAQHLGWHDVLIEWGFKECVTALNSNSMNTITVYLLGY